jgi:hypothetical protein
MSATPDGIYGSGPIGSQGPCVLLRPNVRSPHRPFAVSLLMQGHAGGGRRLRDREFFL